MKPGILIVAAVAVIVFLMSIFTVKEYEYAIKFRLGEIVRSDYEPGLHFKFPLVNNVLKLDKRIRTLDMPPERMNTSELKLVEVDFFVQWRIVDQNLYYQSTRGSLADTNARLSPLIRNVLREQLAKRTLTEVVSRDRRQADESLLPEEESEGEVPMAEDLPEFEIDEDLEMMEAIVKLANDQFSEIGIEVIDVRIKRIELTEDVLNSVFERMEAQRQELAKRYRALGREQAAQIEADADRQARVIEAQAERQANRLRGEGDASATEIYAEAYNRDPEFYAFYRSLEAYGKSFDAGNDMLLLDAGSDFFRYFGNKGEAKSEE